MKRKQPSLLRRAWCVIVNQGHDRVPDPTHYAIVCRRCGYSVKDTGRFE